jgi:hypothetical protein
VSSSPQGQGGPAARSAAVVLLIAWCAGMPAAATPAGEWAASARDPQNTRFSPLEQVTRHARRPNETARCPLSICPRPPLRAAFGRCYGFF